MTDATITNLTSHSDIYTSNAWLYSCGSAGPGCLTLIDTGCDPKILFSLRDIKRRTGTTPLDQVIITHGHYDHAKMAGPIRDEFGVPVYGWSSYTAGVDRLVTDRETIPAGEDILEVIHIPGHTTDSLVIYSRNEKVLFSGDSPLFIWGRDGTYEPMFIRAFDILMDLDITGIYPGHGEPVLNNVRSLLEESYGNLKECRII